MRFQTLPVCFFYLNARTIDYYQYMQDFEWAHIGLDSCRNVKNPINILIYVSVTWRKTLDVHCTGIKSVLCNRHR